MKVVATALPEVLILEPRVFRDERGFLFESWNARTFREATGLDAAFVQDNHSHSVSNVLRGIHYQIGKPQGKLVRVVSGSVLDVAVDLRRSSPNFGKWAGVELSAENQRQLWIPTGFGHAFQILSNDGADVLYKSTEYWAPELDRAIRWNDPDIGILWNLENGEPIVSARDRGAPFLRDVQTYD